MSSTVEPIRQGVTPELDIEREMLDFVAMELCWFREEYGESPEGVAVVLIGRDHGDVGSSANSWSPGNEDRSRLHCCAVGAALLTKRALGL